MNAAVSLMDGLGLDGDRCIRVIPRHEGPLCVKVVDVSLYEVKIKLGVFTWNISSRVPTRTGKPGKMGRHFPVREKSGNFEQTGKVREKSGKITQNTGKLVEFQTNIIFYFLVIFKLTVYYFAEMHQIFSYKINF